MSKSPLTSQIYTPVGSKADVDNEIQVLLEDLRLKKISKEAEYWSAIQKKEQIARKMYIPSSNDSEKSSNVPIDGDIIAGSYNFMRNCTGCHTIHYNSLGSAPSLATIYGKKVGSDKNYSNYSDSMIRANFVWSSKNLYRFLKNPQDLIKGTRCEIEGGGIKSEEIRSDIVMFLKSFTKEMHIYMKNEAKKVYGKEYVDNQIVAQKYLNEIRKNRAV